MAKGQGAKGGLKVQEQILLWSSQRECGPAGLGTSSLPVCFMSIFLALRHVESISPTRD